MKSLHSFEAASLIFSQQEYLSSFLLSSSTSFSSLFCFSRSFLSLSCCLKNSWSWFCSPHSSLTVCLYFSACFLLSLASAATSTADSSSSLLFLSQKEVEERELKLKLTPRKRITQLVDEETKQFFGRDFFCHKDCWQVVGRGYLPSLIPEVFEYKTPFCDVDLLFFTLYYSLSYTFASSSLPFNCLVEVSASNFDSGSWFTHHFPETSSSQ